MKLTKYICKCGCETMKAEHRKECHGCENLMCDYENEGRCDCEDFSRFKQPCPTIKSDCAEFYRNETDCEAGSCYGGGCWILNCSACGNQVEQVPEVEP